MGKKNRIIPFALLPKFWGASIEIKEKEFLRYYLDGEDLDYSLLEVAKKFDHSLEADKNYLKAKIGLDLKYGKISEYLHDSRILEIDIPDKKSKDYRKKLTEIRFKHGIINERAYEEELLGIDYKSSSKEYKLGLLQIQFEFDEITQVEYEKQKATLSEEPWVHVLEAKIIYKDGVPSFEFELDWNQHFIADLIKNGWHGPSPEDIIDAWFTETCKDIFINEIDDMGDIVVVDDTDQ